MIRAAEIIVAPEELPPGEIGVPYTQQITASGGTPPYSFARIEGEWPEGLALDSSGLLCGTVRQRASTAVVVCATDRNSVRVSRSYEISFGTGRLAIMTPSQLPPAGLGFTYKMQLEATGGRPPYSWSQMRGKLPDGLSLSREGLISGTANTKESSSVAIAVSDSADPPSSAAAPFSLAIESCALFTKHTSANAKLALGWHGDPKDPKGPLQLCSFNPDDGGLMWSPEKIGDHFVLWHRNKQSGICAAFPFVDNFGTIDIALYDPTDEGLRLIFESQQGGYFRVKRQGSEYVFSTRPSPAPGQDVWAFLRNPNDEDQLWSFTPPPTA